MISELLIMVQDSIYRQPGLTGTTSRASLLLFAMRLILDKLAD
jgi:hypothetical protein